MGSSDITNVYAALDRTHTVVALERSRRGDEGFRTFFDEFADYAANKGYIPYLLLLNFHVDDGSRLPPIEAKERGYRLAHLAPLEVKDIRQALTCTTCSIAASTASTRWLRRTPPGTSATRTLTRASATNRFPRCRSPEHLTGLWKRRAA